MIDKAAWRSIRAAGRAIAAKDLEVRVEGIEHLPAEGPVILAARHYHHAYDGCALFATVPRQMQVLVGLDWIERPMALKGMQAACRSAGWPVVFRNASAVDRRVWMPMLRAALAESQAILAKGNVLLVFPEGYPTIDPHGSPKTRDDQFLPFNPGFARIALDAWRVGIPAQIVPVGLRYTRGEKWTVLLRFGDAIGPQTSTSAAALTGLVERRVIELSQ